MAQDRPADKLAVILHADVADSTRLVQQDEHLAHSRIRSGFEFLSEFVRRYRGRVLELRGDALLAEFDRPSDAVSASLAFQEDYGEQVATYEDDIRPLVRVGVAMGEVIVADGTATGAGVVLSQRVEQLSEPGGVCITGAIHEALPNRMPFDYENLGEREIKGFDDPMRVFRVALQTGAPVPTSRQDATTAKSSIPWKPVALLSLVVLVIVGGIVYKGVNEPDSVEPASVERMALPLPDKPSIAVLPFTNMSGDAEQEYFVDGMTEDLITDISKVPELFVIARNSVFTYKGKAVKVRQVAEELGVRYVLEGSVRRAGDQVRINAQLIDATTGGHLWAERYDGSMADVFALQDTVTAQIVAALELNLQGGTKTSKTASAQAYDAFLQGWSYYQRRTQIDLVQAVPFFESAIERDPDYAQAHAAMAAVYWDIWENQWADALGLSADEIMTKSKKHLDLAMKEPSSLAHRIASNILIAEGNYANAVAEAEQVIALDSNDAAGYATLANALALAGKTDESENLLAKAERLDPFASRLHAAVLKGDVDTVAELIADGVPVDDRNHRGRTALHLAAIYNQAASAKLLIEAGADVEKTTSFQTVEFRDLGSSPLVLTAIRGSTEVAGLLISAGAEIDARDSWEFGGWSALHHAAEHGQIGVAKLLIENGARIDMRSRRKETPLVEAVRHGHQKIVDLLIGSGADFKVVNHISQTLLHIAVQSRDLKIVQLLIAKGVDINAKTTAGSYPGHTALHISALTGQVKAAELLLINDAEVDAVDRFGYTPLRRSIDFRNIEMARLLISKGADIDTRDINGITLLHILAQTDEIELAALLLDAGADVNAKDKNLGFTPLDYALGGDPAMIELLERHGAVCTSC